MNLISLAESLRIVQEVGSAATIRVEKIPTRSALRRVLAEAVRAQKSTPRTSVAAMDGIAVNALQITEFPAVLEPHEWKRINTGETIPSEFNTVVKVEDLKWDLEDPIIENPVTYMANVRWRAEDFDIGETLLPKQHQLLPQDLSLLLAAGQRDVVVHQRPTITFIPTGTELVHDISEEEDGKLVESNSAMIAGLVESWGGQFQLLDPVPDDPNDLAQILRMNLKASQIVVISAGTSRGTADRTAEVLRLMGKVHFHGVAMSPGRPVILAELEGVPVLGLPGYPVAAYLGATHFLRSLVCAYSGVRAPAQRSVFISSEDLPARNQDCFYRVHCFEVEGQNFVRRIPRGASSVYSLSLMDGWMHVPPGVAIKKRDAVRVDLVHDRSTNAVAIRGFEDPAILQLFDRFQEAVPHHRLLFSESTSEEALQSIIERHAHMAVIRTPESGSDLYVPFERSLQETILRYRICSRFVGLTLRPGVTGTTPTDLPENCRIGIPHENRFLWEEFVNLHRVPSHRYRVEVVSVSSRVLAESLLPEQWEAVFIDLRLAKTGQTLEAKIEQNLDLIVSENFSQMSPIDALLEILLSDPYGTWLTQNGCSIENRGMLFT